MLLYGFNKLVKKTLNKIAIELILHQLSVFIIEFYDSLISESRGVRNKKNHELANLPLENYTYIFNIVTYNGVNIAIKYSSILGCLQSKTQPCKKSCFPRDQNKLQSLCYIQARRFIF